METQACSFYRKLQNSTPENIYACCIRHTYGSKIHRERIIALYDQNCVILYRC